LFLKQAKFCDFTLKYRLKCPGAKVREITVSLSELLYIIFIFLS
jgi:hypothetical protein